MVGNVATVTVSNGSFGAAGSGNAIVTSVNELSVGTTNGSIWASEVNGLSNLSLDAGTGNVTLTVTEGSIIDTDTANDCGW